MYQPEDEIDVWVVDRALGHGGMGSVYRCHNREAKRILAAVKVLDKSLQRVPNAKARFVREAEILFGIDHPNIVKVRNVRMDLSPPYLEMEFVDGISLEDRISQGPMPVEDALRLFRQAADALVYLHGRGIRHRDIKPSNLLIKPDGDLKLVDFGIATEADGTTLTEHGQTFGSVPYAPPEWMDPPNLDGVRWDIYALGVVFWEVLTGKMAFHLADASEGTQRQWVVKLMSDKQKHPPLDPGPAHPVALRALVRDMTRAQWDERLDDARLVRDRLAEVDVDDLAPDLRFPDADVPRTSAPTWSPEARPPTLPDMRGRTGPTRKGSRGRTVILAGILAGALLATAAAAAWWQARPAPVPAAPDVRVVAQGEGEGSVELPPVVVPPVEPPLAPPAATVAASAAPAVKRPAAAAAPNHAVSTEEFSKWLTRHPEWQTGSDPSYLKGWDGATPPERARGRAMVYVNWEAAKAYCAGRGGLASVTAEPRTWESTDPWHEYRQDGGAPALLRSDGLTPKVQPDESQAGIGFRCAR